VISDPKTANSGLINDNSISPFLANTDFEDSYLIIVQNGMQSETELVLDTISRRKKGIHLDISIHSPQSGPDDLLIHSLLIKITDENKGVPDTAGYNFVKIFDTTGCQYSSGDYSRQYEEVSVNIDGYV
jgi:hypothetical protein